MKTLPLLVTITTVLYIILLSVDVSQAWQNLCQFNSIDSMIVHFCFVKKKGFYQQGWSSCTVCWQGEEEEE